MAEERLIDEDKDRKYRIRVNEDGEEELIIDAAGEEETEKELFEVPEEKSADDEDEAVMTPEQLAAKREAEAKAKRERDEKVQEYIDRAAKDCRAHRYATALEYLEKAEELDDENGEIYATRLAAYTRNFTDYDQIVEAAESAEGIGEYLSNERKEEIASKIQTTLDDNIATLRNRVVALDKQNEEKKAERAAKFKKDLKNSLYVLVPVLLLFGGFLGTAIYYLMQIYNENTGLYFTYTVVFGVLALLALIGAAVCARFVNIACHRLKVNKRNTSTQLGRDLLAEQEKLKAFLAISNALKVK